MEKQSSPKPNCRSTGVPGIVVRTVYPSVEEPIKFLQCQVWYTNFKFMNYRECIIKGFDRKNI